MKNKKEIVPVVVYHKPKGCRVGVYEYQVFTAEYCIKNHTILNVSKNYQFFGDEEEISAYIKGLEVGGLYEQQ
jgi:hypothetical protein